MIFLRWTMCRRRARQYQIRRLQAHGKQFSSHLCLCSHPSRALVRRRPIAALLCQTRQPENSPYDLYTLVKWKDHSHRLRIPQWFHSYLDQQRRLRRQLLYRKLHWTRPRVSCPTQRQYHQLLRSIRLLLGLCHLRHWCLTVARCLQLNRRYSICQQYLETRQGRRDQDLLLGLGPPGLEVVG